MEESEIHSVRPPQLELLNTCLYLARPLGPRKQHQCSGIGMYLPCTPDLHAHHQRQSRTRSIIHPLLHSIIMLLLYILACFHAALRRHVRLITHLVVGPAAPSLPCDTAGTWPDKT